MLVLIQSFFIAVSVYAQPYKQQKEALNDTLISSSLAQINADSIKSTIQSLQNFGTRFMLAPNRRDIAVWLKNKYISIGYENTVIDSFLVVKQWNNNTYTLNEYNVIATLTGELNPEIVCVMGGHYDSYSQTGDPMITAPGADDNASGTAAAIEVARVMKKNKYIPAFTIQFVAFAAEELMLSPGGCGSCYFASKAKATGRKILMMINNDMISYTASPGNWKIKIQPYDNSGWVSNLAFYITRNYTLLSAQEGYLNAWSDSRPFYDEGFCAVYFEESDFSPFYHRDSDSVANYNMPYCAEVAKISCGMLLYQSKHPNVKNLHSVQEVNTIRITWNKNRESNVAGYNVYRSTDPAGTYSKLNSSLLPINDTLFTDQAPQPLTEYYYAAVTVDALQKEGTILEYDSAMILTLNQGILIVDDSQSEFLDPPDPVVDAFYDSLLVSFHPHHYDISSSGPIPLAELGKYSTVLWHTDRFTNGSKFFESQNVLKQYLVTGGNLLLTTERFIYTTMHAFTSAKAFYPGSFVYDYLQCDSIFRNASSRFYKARPLLPGYPSMEIDTTKTPVGSNHHLSLIESVYKLDGAKNIYAYDSRYDSTSVQGSMKGLPVGYEYRGNRSNLIVLSFPLWYMRRYEAKAFVTYAMRNVFDESLSIPETNPEENRSMIFPCFPNPFSATTTIRYYLPEAGYVKLGIYDLIGKLLTELVNKSQPEGTYSCVFNSNNLINGLYFCTLTTTRGSHTIKLVVLK